MRLPEKGETIREQPVSPTLMRGLEHHRDTRGDGDPNAQLLRYRNRRPISARRYDHIFDRVGRFLPWVTAHGMTVEDLSDLDLSYTPPLSSPWDAVEVAAQLWSRQHRPGHRDVRV